MKRIILIYPLILTLSGCSGIRGYGESHSPTYSDLCVIENKKVTVPFFEEDLIAQLESRELNIKVASNVISCDKSIYLTYTARRSMGAVTKIKLSIYDRGSRIGHIDWDAGRSPMPAKVTEKNTSRFEFWQITEALSGLFGEIPIN